MQASDEKATAQGDLGADGPGGASIEKVRDILFGVQMREYDKRFARLEERLSKDTAELRDDVKRRLAALEHYVRQEIDALGERLTAEQGERGSAVKQIGQELRDQGSALEKRCAAIEDQGARAQREMRQQLLEQQQRLTDEIQQRHQELLAALGRESSELRDDKADRAALASLFTEMAMRLNNQFRLPSTEGV
jgi:DNA anti-recombination protein RmuC